MAKIFLSYRRHDSSYAVQVLKDRLEQRFGEDSVFLDIDSIPIGVDFREHIDAAVKQCGVMLVLMGDEWLRVMPGNARNRLFDAPDFVRTEIEAAFRRSIPIIPLLTDSAQVPTAADLPESIQLLAYRNAAELRPGRDFNSHMVRLIDSLDQLLHAATSRPPGQAERPAESGTAHSQSSPAVAARVEKPAQAEQSSSPTNRKAILEAFKGVPNCFAAPDIPHDKLAKALKTFGSGVSLRDVVFLYDDTIFNSATVGVLLTETAVYWRNRGADPESMLFEQVESVQVVEAFVTVKVFLNLKPIAFRYPDVAHAVAKFFTAFGNNN